MYKKNANFVATQVTYKMTPGIYEGKIVGIRKGKITRENEEKDVLEILFEEKSGKKHLDTVGVPREGSEEAAFERFCHILSAHYSTAELDKLTEVELEDFDGFCDWAINSLKPKLGTPVLFKIAGSVYNENAISKVPNYSSKYTVPFIVSVASGQSLTFTKNEIADNAAYTRKISGVDAAPSASPSLGGASLDGFAPTEDLAF
jgi:hypothetical protein